MKALTLAQDAKIAIVGEEGIGDGLVMMILVNNLRRANFDVTLFCSAILPLASWFNGVKVLPYPKDPAWVDTLSAFNVVVLDRNVIDEVDVDALPQTVRLHKRDFERDKHYVENLTRISKELFSLPIAAADNGAGLPPGESLVLRKYPKRVLINPVSADTRKDWPAKKFIALARKIKRDGYDPHFCVPPHMHDAWKSIVADEFPLPRFDSLSAFTAYIYESGVNIANDSGSGHIASCLGVPTLSLFGRKNKALLWRPGWGKNIVVTASIHLPTPYARPLWKYLLTVNKVYNGFNQLEK